MSFVHLHNHSHYSLLDGMTTPEEMCRVAAEQQQTHIALTDHGTCAGWLRFQEAGAKYNIKPIFGIEAYFVESLDEDDGDKRAERFHLIMLAQTDEGMQNICKLQREAWTNGFYYKNRIDFEMLKKYGKGIAATSACMGGIIARSISAGDHSTAERWVNKFDSVFDEFYIELQPWNPHELNNGLISIAEALDKPLIASMDCHYPTHEHKKLEEILLCLGQWPSMKASELQYVKDHYIDAKRESDLINRLDVMYPDRRLRFADNDHYIMSESQVVEQFKAVDIVRQDMIDNTSALADKCYAKIKTGQSLLPKYLKKGDSYEYLKDLAEFKLGELGLDDNEEYTSRLIEELEVIRDKDFSDYFLVIWDVVNWAKNNNIMVGPGRGSAAGSLLAYALGITALDPIKHGLIFWRFINPERNDYPDIDLDFEDRRRNEVKTYLKDRWGEANVASIATYGEFKAKGLVKDVARVLGCPVKEAMQVTQHFDTLEKYKESDKLKQFRKEWPEIESIAAEMNGRIRQAGFHAAGVVISNRPLDEVAPVETRKDPSSEDRIEVVAYDMEDCQKVGLIKLDALGLNTLSVIHDCYDAVKERHSVDIWDDSLALDDARVYAEFNSGNTVGVFQTESSAYKRLIINMGIDNFTDLAASNGLVRPGAQASQTDTYIERKRGRQKITYLHPILEPITKESYGTFVYQEQVMETAVKLAGFKWSEADKLRKIIGKKQDVAEFEVWRKRFVDGASAHITAKQAEKLFSDFEKFAGYAFVKAHSYAYSVLSYQTMWMKVYYPTEFMWALIKNEGDAQNRATYLLEAKRLGIEIKAPDINNSGESMTLFENSIMFGLGEILGVGPSALQELLKRRPFVSLEELQAKCHKAKVKSNCIEALDKVGAFASIGHSSVYEHQRYYYSMLNYPIDINMATTFDGKLSKVVDFIIDESKVGFIKAIVKSTKRKDNYFRIEFEDDSGSFAVFGNLAMEIKPGDFLLALVGDKALYTYIDVYDIPESLDTPMLKFLSNDSPLVEWEEAYALGAGTLDQMPLVIPKDKSYKALVHLVGVAKFKTKAGKDMATITMWDGTDMYKAVVFPQMYGAVYFKMKPWETVVVSLERLKDGSLSVRLPGMVNPSDYIKMKRK